MTSDSRTFQKSYSYRSEELFGAHDFLLPALTRLLEQERQKRAEQKLRLFDLGCGNGSVAEGNAE